MVRKLLGAGGLLLVLAACSEDSGELNRGLVRVPAAASGAGAGGMCGTAVAGGPSPDYAVDTAALEGCRSPDEDGCSECCQTGTTPCAYRKGGLGGQPVYSESGVRDEACAPTCKPCAACSKATELSIRRTLSTLACRPNCDCTTIGPTLDPCIVPDSCACLCSGISADLSACPPAVE